MSYTRLLYHIIFRTKHGAPSINEQYEKELVVFGNLRKLIIAFYIV